MRLDVPPRSLHAELAADLVEVGMAGAFDGPPAVVRVVTASRVDAAAFGATPLCRSLARAVVDLAVELHATCDNREGLPAVYNRQICADNRDQILVFVHDDVWIDDLHFALRVRQALQTFDIVGVAGNRRRRAGADSWAFGDDGEPDRGWLSGSIGHGQQPLGEVSLYGPAPADVELLDGVLLAARCSSLLDAGVCFDERFSFHFYDLDFCRVARQAGLRLGTLPLALTHASVGAFGSAGWLDGRARYRSKWSD